MANKGRFEITKLEPRVAPTSGVFGAADSLNATGDARGIANDGFDFTESMSDNANVSDVANGNHVANGNVVSVEANVAANVTFSDGSSVGASN